MASKSLTFDIYGRDKTASKTLDGIGGSANKMGEQFAKVGKVVAAAAAVAVIAWAKSSVDSLARIESINAQTTAVLKSTGNAAGVSAGHIEDLATALEKKTASEGEAIQEGANLLLTFKNIRNEAGAGNDIFDQTTGIMVDMSRAMGTEAGDAAVQLGKALNDPIAGISALSRVGITFSEDQKAVIEALVESGDTMGAQKVILQELQDQFGGSGAAFAETFAGKVDLIGHAWGEVGENLFTKAMPALEDLADWMLEEGIPALDDFFASVVENKDILGPAATAVGVLTAAMWLLNAAMAANPVGLVAAGLIALVAMFTWVTINLEELQETNVNAAQSVVDFFTSVGSSIGGFASEVGANIVLIVAWLVGLPGRVAASLVEMTARMRNAGADMINGMIDGMMSRAGGLLSRIREIASSVVNAAKDALGIQSPSTVFRDEVGQFIPAGLAEGIDGGKSKVTAAISSLVDVPAVPRVNGPTVAAPAQRDRPIMSDGIGLLGWVREMANGEAQLVWATAASADSSQFRRGVQRS